MSWSLNEIEALARKATRGAGYTWGLAEEAGRATRWTCAAGWPGAAALAALLTRNDTADLAKLGPQELTGTWTAQSGLLCPIVTGAALCDLAEQWARGQSLTLGPTAHPMLLVPYMVWAADRTGAALSLGWQDMKVTRASGDTYVEGSTSTLTAATTERIQLNAATPAQASPLTRRYRADPEPEAITTLTALAGRTYAPETEESRLAGAGAGLTDND